MTVVYNPDPKRLSPSAESSDDEAYEEEYSDSKLNSFEAPRAEDDEKGRFQMTVESTGHRATTAPAPVHSRDSSLSSLSNFSRKLTINTKSSLPESFSKLSSKFKRNNSVSSSNLNIFTRKPSISLRSLDSPDSSIYSNPNSNDDFFDFENVSVNNNSNSSGGGTLQRINSWSNHRNASGSSPSGSGFFQSKLAGKGAFFTTELESLKFRGRANSSPQQTLVSRKSSISVQNLNLIKKKNIGGLANHSSSSNYSFELSDRPLNASFHSAADVSDEYFSKQRVASSTEFYLDNLDTLDFDLDSDKLLAANTSTTATYTSTTATYTGSASAAPAATAAAPATTSPLTLNSYKFSTPELRCEEFETSSITTSTTADHNLDSSSFSQHQPHHPPHHHSHLHSSLGIVEPPANIPSPSAYAPGPGSGPGSSNPVKSFPGWSLKDGLLVPNDDSG